MLSKNNKLFWDGSDWNRVKKISEYNINTEFIIKKSLLGRSLGWQTFFILEKHGIRIKALLMISFQRQ